MCRLREAALAEANGWHRTILPDYAQQDCIHRGNKILRRRGLDRILESDEVNRLVRHYSHIDQNSQAAEEWWAGAVALNHFLTGLPDMIAELATTNLGQRHKWRAWIVNTQHSEQLGSHWFTASMYRFVSFPFRFVSFPKRLVSFRFVRLIVSNCVLSFSSVSFRFVY